MAAPQFFSPPKVTPSRSVKRFTLAEANQSLVYVERVVRDLSTTHQTILANQDKLDHVAGKDRIACERDIAGGKARFSMFLDELTTMGVDLKDAGSGLIDFTGRHKGHDVSLCWKLGERAVGYFHEMDAGFAGRQPVSKLDERD